MTGKPYTSDHTAALYADVRLVTPAEARGLRDSCHFDRQREVRAGHVRRLADEMKHGWFLAGTPVWLCVLPDKSMLLVNGNHTLEAVAESGVEIPLTFVYQQVASVEAAAEAYACFDIQRTRTWGQAAHAAGIDADLPDSGKTIAAVGMIQAGFSPGPNVAGMFSRAARFQLLEEYRPAALFLHAALSGSSTTSQNLVHRAAIFSVALATARYQPSAAEEFWRGLVMDDGLRSNDPRKVLLRYLQNNPAAGSQTRRDQSVAAAIAWNAHFAGRTITLLRPSSSLTFELAGTPWAKAGPVGPLTFTRKPPRLHMGRRVNGRGEPEVVSVYSG